jgi:hypothetical protein
MTSVDGGCGACTIRPKMVVVAEECSNAKQNCRKILIKNPLKGY